MPFDTPKFANPEANGFFESQSKAIDIAVPLAIQAHRIDIQEKNATARFDYLKQRLADETTKAQEKIGEENFKFKMKTALENGLPQIITGMENTGELKKYTGLDQWPRITKMDRSSAEDLPTLTGTDELQMPMSKEDKQIMIDAGKEKRQSARDEANWTRMQAHDQNMLSRMMAGIGAREGSRKKSYEFFSDPEGQVWGVNKEDPEDKVKVDLKGANKIGTPGKGGGSAAEKLRKALNPGAAAAAPDAKKEYKIGDEVMAKGKRWKFKGNDQWEEVTTQ
jgi:hypothetical protein